MRILPRSLRVVFGNRAENAARFTTRGLRLVVGGGLRSVAFSQTSSLRLLRSIRLPLPAKRGVRLGRLRVSPSCAPFAGWQIPATGLVMRRTSMSPGFSVLIRLAASCRKIATTSCRRFALLVHNEKLRMVRHPAEERRGHPAHNEKGHLAVCLVEGHFTPVQVLVFHIKEA